ncbi:uncharacterized mitochondrial protein AtMg00300-like [Ziziphus jujuba]|uniref:Uncharacterized mitochondrial protein AtMg00300-like n=1 Tax=Ziziphus jujuba TaxID=326968 RepID=A0ABM3ISY9_ZIZJJ|nr:uncharacterized mitochondrial protein AtMg00300-like [Ziziphus jujuba]
MGPNRYSYKAERGTLKVLKGLMVAMKASKKNSLYVLGGNVVQGEASVSVNEKVSDTTLWHRRLGHISEKGLIELSKQGLLCGHKAEKLDFCEHCIYGKQARVKFNIAVHQTKGILDYVHSDV